MPPKATLKPDAEVIDQLAKLIEDGSIAQARKVRQRILTFPVPGTNPGAEDLQIATDFTRAVFPQDVINKGNGQFLAPTYIETWFQSLRSDQMIAARLDQLGRALTQGNAESDESFHSRVLLDYLTKTTQYVAEDRQSPLHETIVAAARQIEAWDVKSVSEFEAVRVSLTVLGRNHFKLLGKTAEMTAKQVDQALMSIYRRDHNNDDDDDHGGDRTMADLVGAFNDLVRKPELAKEVAEGKKTLTQAERENKAPIFEPPEPDTDPDKNIKRANKKQGNEPGRERGGERRTA